VNCGSVRSHLDFHTPRTNTRRKDPRMKLSTDRILTTHVGSLPRPRPVIDLILAKEQGRAVDPAALEVQVAKAVEDVVTQQVKCGIDVVNDGEMSKPSYTMYVRHRVTGIQMDQRAAEKGRDIMLGRDSIDHPDLASSVTKFANIPFPGCVGDLNYADRGALERDLANLKAAIAKAKPVETFMTAPSPGILTRFVINLHYPSDDAYLEALGNVMRTEYEAIAGAGFLLQIDAPDLASARNNQHRNKTDEEFLKIAARNIEVLNFATAKIPADRMRLHICWGNYVGAHTHDIALSKIIDVCLKARPNGLSFEGANPRHEHEWEDLQSVKIPEEKVLIPGLIDSTSNFVEHPRLIAQRLRHYTDIVGRERVIAGGDCGFGTFVSSGPPMVADSIVWAKFKALAEGARIASEQLWAGARKLA
jgi:5-methyltetrahydropteroyltriglutamate--homocysteine methyltransferase